LKCGFIGLFSSIDKKRAICCAKTVRLDGNAGVDSAITDSLDTRQTIESLV